jgi:hypothetical protein
MNGYGGKEEKWCENFSQRTIPFIESFLHFDWLEHYLLQPRGQSRLAMWQQFLTAWETEIFNCCHVRCLEGERLKYSLLMNRTKVHIFWQFTHSIRKLQGSNFGKFRG